MVKTAKPKSDTKPKSAHSRAARRAVSPSLDVDKSITSLPRPETTVSVSTPVLGAQHNSGVSKKKKSKQKSRAQKLRQEKGLQRAEIVMDKTEKKVSNSVQRGKRVKARKAAWEDLNGEKREVKIQNNDAMDTSEQEEQAPPSRPVKFDAPTAIPASDENIAVELEEEDEIT